MSIDELLSAAQRPEREVIRFIPEARVEVFLDCLQFSIVTTATVGYSDIAPRSRYAKAAADTQILSAVALFVVALAMVFGDWWSGGRERPSAPASGTIPGTAG